MALGLVTVIQKRRVVTLGGDRLTRETLAVDMNKQSLADVRKIVQDLTVVETRRELEHGNPPQLIEVDGRAARPLEDVDKRVVVIFGTQLAASAMREVELELAAAIARSTTSHSGRLANLAANWTWRFIPKQGAARLVTAANPPTTFAVGDQLVLMPQEVPYATIVNAMIASSGRANKRLSMRALSKPIKAMSRAARARQNRGFFYWAAEAARRRAAFKQFTVKVVFSAQHAVPGEVRSRKGSAMIVIRPRLRLR